MQPGDMNRVVSRKYVGPARSVLVLVSLIMLLYGVSLLWAVWQTFSIVPLVAGVMLAVFGVLGCIAVPRQRTTVSEEYVENRRFRTVRVDFDDVVWAQMRLGELIISDGRRKVVVNRVAQNGRALFDAAVEQLKRQPNVEYRGDPQILSLHFGVSAEAPSQDEDF